MGGVRTIREQFEFRTGRCFLMTLYLTKDGMKWKMIPGEMCIKIATLECERLCHLNRLAGSEDTGQQVSYRVDKKWWAVGFTSTSCRWIKQVNLITNGHPSKRKPIVQKTETKSDSRRHSLGMKSRCLWEFLNYRCTLLTSWVVAAALLRQDHWFNDHRLWRAILRIIVRLCTR